MNRRHDSKLKKVYKIRLQIGDNVIVRSGKYKGQAGKVIATHSVENKVTVEGVNIVKKHIKPNRKNPQGGIIEITKPIWVSKVAIIEPGAKKPDRIGYKLDKDGTKVRIYKRTGKEVKS